MSGLTTARLFIVMAGTLMFPVFVGCSQSDSSESETESTVYVDLKSGEAVLAEPSQQLPAVNPATGRATLMPALYCPTCEKWYPAPPADQLNRQPGAGLCPKTKTPLIHDGPRPE